MQDGLKKIVEKQLKQRIKQERKVELETQGLKGKKI